MAGLLYLPRIFVYHVENLEKKETTKIFETMERRLYYYIMRPAMLITWLFWHNINLYKWFRDIYKSMVTSKINFSYIYYNL